VGVGFSAATQMASPLSPSRRKQPAAGLSRSALKVRDALVLEHLPLANAIASVTARRLFPLVEREDLIQVAREALVRSAPRCRAGEPADPYLRRCIGGALQHHLRDRVRLVRVPRRLHEQGQCPLGHSSLDASTDGEPCLLDQLAAPEAEPAMSEVVNGLALEQLVDQLPAAQATALRLTVLEGLSLRQAAERLEISCMSVQRAQKKALVALRQQLVGAEALSLLLLAGGACSGPLQSEAFLSSGLLWDRSRRCAALGADHHGHALICRFCLLPARRGSVPAAGVLRQGH
jgi:RNA polymerase sigma factor (sigma-70 family)